jgi:hypothetical protein
VATTMRGGGSTRRILLLGCAIALGSCSDPLSPENVAGVYTLVSVDGTPLPFVLEASLGIQSLVTAGQIVLNSDQTCTSSRSFALSEPDRYTDFGAGVTDCVYALGDASLEVTLADAAPGETETWSLFQSQILRMIDDSTYLYEK